MFCREVEFKDSPIGKVPQSWATGDASFLKILKGYPFESRQFNKDKVGKPLIRIRDLGKTKTESHYSGRFEEAYLVQKGDILVAMDGEFSVNLWKGPVGLLNQRVCKIAPHNPKELDPLFLFYELQKPLKVIESQIGQTTVKHLLDSDLDKIKIPLPKIEEQKAIVGILGVVDSAIDYADRVIAKTERLKRGLMQQLLTRGIGHTETKQTPIGTIPKEWETTKLGDALEQCQYGLSVKFGETGEYPILKMDDIVNGVAVPDKVKRVDLDPHIFNDFKLEKGDVLFNRTNSYEHVGRTGIFLLNGDYTFASYLIRLRPKKELIDSQFLTFYLIYSSDRLKQLATRAVHQANINATNLQSFPIVLPPLDEQKKIAQIILTLDHKLGLEYKEMGRLEQIKKGLMDLLLTGKVRIKVD